jgi:hypothetical protein
MKKKHLSHFIVVAFLGLLANAAQADEIDNSGNLGTANQVDNYTFSVTSAGDVNLYTTSNFPTNPYLTLWTQSGGDWLKVAVNDDRVGANYNETGNSWDAKIEQVLNAGNYEVSVSWSGNTPNGNVLSAGFTQGGNGGAGLFDSYNHYTLAIIGNVSPNLAAVPLPTTAWLFGSVLMGYLGWSKKKQQTI